MEIDPPVSCKVMTTTGTNQLNHFQTPIHTVIDDPIDITSMPEKEALEHYRDVLATWYYIMMEKYVDY